MTTFLVECWSIIKNDGSEIGPVLGGFSLLLGAAAAWATLFMIHKRTLYVEWVDGFRAIYREFWQDDDISTVRRWITSDLEYDLLKNVLVERLKKTNNDLDSDSNAVLEKLDKYLALISRVRSFDKDKMNKDQRQLWSDLYERFWITKMYSRLEVKEYVEKFWTNLHKITYK